MATSAIEKKAISRLVREWIQEERRKDRTWDAIGEDLGGVTRATLSSLNEGQKGVGEKTKQAFADLKFEGSIDALRRAAMGEMGAGAAPEQSGIDLSRVSLSSDARKTIAYALDVEKILPDAIIEVLSTQYAGDAGEDLLDIFRIINRKMLRGEVVGKRATEANSREHPLSIEARQKTRIG